MDIDVHSDMGASVMVFGAQRKNEVLDMRLRSPSSRATTVAS